MSKVRVVYGSSTGDGFRVAKLICGELSDLVESVHSIAHTAPDALAEAESLILGVSTWGAGELQQDWKRFFPKLDEIDLSGKTVALYGLGDARGYSGEFVTALGTLYRKVKERGARVVGFWPTEGYQFRRSTAIEDGRFVGLVLDQENEPAKTKARVKRWASEIRPHFERSPSRQQG
jgi:flavodoxin I